jgi:hypothetical protein
MFRRTAIAPVLDGFRPLNWTRIEKEVGEFGFV